MWAYLLFALSVSLLINITLFLVAFPLRTDRLTDTSYALSFIILVLVGLHSHAPTRYQLLVGVMVILWALRLGGFLLFRIWHTGKDSRFDGVRDSFRKFGTFWVGQGLSVWVILIPTLLALHNQQAHFSLLVWIGLVVWLTGLVIETTADIQKYRFNANPVNKGQWIERGIWRYSRHPNYLGEIMVWIGVYLVAFPALNGPERLVALVGPLFITCLLLFVSGIPPLEKSANERWGTIPAYKMYRAKTSILLLLPRKK